MSIVDDGKRNEPAARVTLKREEEKERARERDGERQRTRETLAKAAFYGEYSVCALMRSERE